ncbi:predicted protein, partial [Nematostella vectensis]
GNILVLVSVATTASLQTVPDLFIGSLAVADLLVVIVQQPCLIARVTLDGSLGQTFLDVLNSIGNLSLIASVTSMFAVTIDRLFAIQRPFRYAVLATKPRALIVIAGAWGVCALLTVMAVLLSEGESITGRLVLWGYVSILLVAIVLIYFYLFIVAQKHANNIVTVQAPSTTTTGNNKPVNQKQERKAAKTIAIVVGVFITFWIPFLSFTISQASVSGTPAFMRVFYWVWSISMCNSAVNPYIYCARSIRYRRSFWRLL